MTGWLNGYNYRYPIAIDKSKVGSAQEYFPVRISIGSSVGLGSKDMTEFMDYLRSKPDNPYTWTGSNGDNFDTAYWTNTSSYNTSYSRVYNNTWRIYKPTASGDYGNIYLWNKNKLSGDFDITINANYVYFVKPSLFSIESWFQLLRYDGAHTDPMIQIGRLWDGGGNTLAHLVYGGSYTRASLPAYSNMDFRIARTGASCSTYYRQNGTTPWTLLATDACTTVDLKVRLHDNPEEFRSYDVRWDNMTHLTGDWDWWTSAYDADDRKFFAVTTWDGITKCYCEIESYDFTANTMEIWASIPNVEVAVDTPIYLYVDGIDNSAFVGDTGDVVARNVWTQADYIYVQHSQSGTTITNSAGALDGTGRNIDATNEVTATIGKGLKFNDGVADEGNWTEVQESDYPTFFEVLTKAPAGEKSYVSNYNSSDEFSQLISAPVGSPANYKITGQINPNDDFSFADTTKWTFYSGATVDTVLGELNLDALTGGYSNRNVYSTFSLEGDFDIQVKSRVTGFNGVSYVEPRIELRLTVGNQCIAKMRDSHTSGSTVRSFAGYDGCGPTGIMPGYFNTSNASGESIWKAVRTGNYIRFYVKHDEQVGYPNSSWLFVGEDNNFGGGLTGGVETTIVLRGLADSTGGNMTVRFDDFVVNSADVINSTEDEREVNSGINVPTGAWYYLAASKDADNINVHVNTDHNSASHDDFIAVDPGSKYKTGYLPGTVTSDFPESEVDEFRIGTDAKSSDWMDLSYYTMFDQLLTFSDSETDPGSFDPLGDYVYPHVFAAYGTYVGDRPANHIEPGGGGDVWYEHVPSLEERETAWIIMNQISQGIAWHILHEASQSVSWHILNQAVQGLAWHIMHEALQGTAWNILPAVEGYVQRFDLRCIDYEFQIANVSGDHCVIDPKQTFELKPITFTTNIKHQIQTTFNQFSNVVANSLSEDQET